MGAERSTGSDMMYLYIIKGHLMQNVDRDTPDAVAREWETKDGKSGVKYELKWKNITGRISNVTFRDSDYGEQCLIKISDGEENIQIQMSTDSRYFSSFAQKFSNIDLNEEIVFNAYDFEKDNKKRAGVVVQQDGKKIPSYFWDPETKKEINGVPMPENGGKGFTKDQWKIYFLKLKIFLKDHMLRALGDAAAIIQPPVQNEPEPQHYESAAPEEEEDDLPF